MSAQAILEAAVAQMLEIAEQAAHARGASNIEFAKAEILEAALAHQIAVMVGDRASQDRLNEAIRMTMERWPNTIRLAHFGLYRRLTQQ